MVIQCVGLCALTYVINEQHHKKSAVEELMSIKGSQKHHELPQVLQQGVVVVLMSAIWLPCRDSNWIDRSVVHHSTSWLLEGQDVCHRHFSGFGRLWSHET